MNEIESLGTDTQVYVKKKLVCSKGSISNQWEKNGLPKKWS